MLSERDRAQFLALGPGFHLERERRLDREVQAARERQALPFVPDVRRIPHRLRDRHKPNVEILLRLVAQLDSLGYETKKIADKLRLTPRRIRQVKGLRVKNSELRRLASGAVDAVLRAVQNKLDLIRVYRETPMDELIAAATAAGPGLPSSREEVDVRVEDLIASAETMMAWVKDTQEALYGPRGA